MSSGPLIFGVMIHGYIDIIVALTSFYVAWIYWPGRFGRLFVLLGLSSLFRAFICITCPSRLMWLADTVQGIILLLFVSGMAHFVIKHKSVLLPVIKRLK